MLKFFAVLGAVLAAMVAVFMIAFNLGWLEPKYKPVEEISAPIVTESNALEKDTEENALPKVAANGYKNGIYKVEAPTFNVTTGWKPVVVVEIREGDIYDISWDEEYKDGGKTKRELSEKGEYMMKEDSVAWHNQVAEAEEYIMDIKNPDEAIKVDTISSVTIDCSPFLELVKLCLLAAKVQ